MTETDILITALTEYRNRLHGSTRDSAAHKVDNLIERARLNPMVPPYIWPNPDGPGWVDAWNGHYTSLNEALRDAAGAVTHPTYLHYGEGLITADEQESRLDAMASRV